MPLAMRVRHHTSTAWAVTDVISLLGNIPHTFTARILVSHAARVSIARSASLQCHCTVLMPRACRVSGNMFACPRLHFRRLVFPWTDPGLGNCSYLDTCRHMRTCKYIHYEINEEADLVTPDMMARQNRPPVPSYLEVLARLPPV